MFTFQKLAALIAVIGVVLAAYRFISKLETASKPKQVKKASWFQRANKPTSKAKKPRVPAAEKTIECQRCGTYFVAGTRPVCDDHQCPFPMRESSKS
jgi:hypothetical protein